MDDYTRIVASILTEAKERSGLSFSKIAERTDIGRATVVRILAGERPITTFYLHELSNIFDVSPADVLTEADARDGASRRRNYDLVANESIDESYDVPDSDFDNA